MESQETREGDGSTGMIVFEDLPKGNFNLKIVSSFGTEHQKVTTSLGKLTKVFMKIVKETLLLLKVLLVVLPGGYQQYNTNKRHAVSSSFIKL